MWSGGGDPRSPQEPWRGSEGCGPSCPQGPGPQGGPGGAVEGHWARNQPLNPLLSTVCSWRWQMLLLLLLPVPGGCPSVGLLWIDNMHTCLKLLYSGIMQQTFRVDDLWWLFFNLCIYDGLVSTGLMLYLLQQVTGVLTTTERVGRTSRLFCF